MSNFIIFISSPRPLYVIPYKVTINAIKQKIFCIYECLICISHDIKRGTEDKIAVLTYARIYFYI